jgi:hypothetical protein
VIRHARCHSLTDAKFDLTLFFSLLLRREPLEQEFFGGEQGIFGKEQGILAPEQGRGPGREARSASFP